RAAAASGPENVISPMCDKSNRPAAVRTALCSASSLWYRRGISQPAKGVSVAPSRSCTAVSGVRRGCEDCGSVIVDAPGAGPGLTAATRSLAAHESRGNLVARAARLAYRGPAGRALLPLTQCVRFGKEARGPAHRRGVRRPGALPEGESY